MSLLRFNMCLELKLLLLLVATATSPQTGAEGPPILVLGHLWPGLALGPWGPGPTRGV